MADFEINIVGWEILNSTKIIRAQFKPVIALYLMFNIFTELLILIECDHFENTKKLVFKQFAFGWF